MPFEAAKGHFSFKTTKSQQRKGIFVGLVLLDDYSPLIFFYFSINQKEEGYYGGGTLGGGDVGGRTV